MPRWEGTQAAGVVKAPVTKTPKQMISTLQALTDFELRSMIILLAEYDIAKIDAAVTVIKDRRSYEDELAAAATKSAKDQARRG